MDFKTSSVPLSKTNQFGKLFLDYLSKKNEPGNLYSEFPDEIGIENFITKNSFNDVNRSVLVSELTLQNQSIQLSNLSQKNINSLIDTNTFTVTTGHQLCLFTGPLYFIYKIISVINYCEFLNSKFSTKKFVPVYWMASEDHDFEEINHAFVFGKKLTWQTSQTGKVGKFSTSGIDDVINELEKIAGTTENARKIIDLFKVSYSKSTLAEATRHLVNELFGKFGLVVLDGDSKNLKSLFSGEITKEIETQFSFGAVSKTSKLLEDKGYSPQVNPRNINLFYAKDKIRERIELVDGIYRVNNSSILFDRKQIKELIKNEIEILSPNVVLRPLYQQKILPNVVYVGGPGEIAYWLQLKAEFDQTGIHFPMLVPRKFVLLLDENVISKLAKYSISSDEIFFSENELINKIIALGEGQIDLNKYKNEIENLFNAIKSEVSSVDKSLEGTTDAELQKTLKGIENIEHKINKALKQKNEIAINQIKTIKQKLFPEGSIQERHDNFIAFYLKSENFIEHLKSVISMNPNELGNYLLLTI